MKMVAVINNQKGMSPFGYQSRAIEMSTFFEQQFLQCLQNSPRCRQQKFKNVFHLEGFYSQKIEMVMFFYSAF